MVFACRATQVIANPLDRPDLYGWIADHTQGGTMWRTLSVCTVLVFFTAHGRSQAPVAGSSPLHAPACEVAPAWPRVPDGWIFGAMAGIATDSRDNVWAIHRAGSVTLKKACCRPAPAVMQFDPAGRLLQSWDGPGTATNGRSPTMSTEFLSTTGITSGSPGEARTGRLKTRS